MKNKSKTKNHSIFSNILFFVKLLFKISPSLVIGELCWGFLDTVPTSLISVLGVKCIIDVMTTDKDASHIVCIIAVIAAALILSRAIMYLFREFMWNVEKEKVYFGLNKQLYEKAKSLDLESYDDPEFYNSFILTIESSSDNIQGLLVPRDNSCRNFRIYAAQPQNRHFANGQTNREYKISLQSRLFRAYFLPPRLCQGGQNEQYSADTYRQIQ